MDKKDQAKACCHFHDTGHSALHRLHPDPHDPDRQAHDDHHHCGCGCGCGGHSALDEIDYPMGSELKVDFNLEATPEEAWNYLTQPDLLKQWFPELTWIDPRPGGTIHYQNQARMVLDFEEGNYLSLAWGKDILALQLAPSSEVADQTVLTFSYWLADSQDEQGLQVLAQWLHHLEVLQGFINPIAEPPFTVEKWISQLKEFL